MRAELKPVTTGWTNATSILLELVELNPDGKDGAVLASQAFTLHTGPGTALHATTKAEGFYVLRLTASKTPASNANPEYTLSVTYTAPATLDQPKAASLSAAVAVGAGAEIG